MHMKAIPDMGQLAAFAGKHKFVLIGGVALLGVGAVVMSRSNAAVSPDATSEAASSFPVVSSFAPIGAGSGYAVGGDAGAISGGSLAPANSASFSGAYGTYSGLDPVTAASFDMARLASEQAQQTVIYNQTLSYNEVVGGLNLDAYSQGLMYGANAGNSNNSVLTSYINAGGNLDPNALAYLGYSLYGVNPVTPTVGYNGPNYAAIPGSNVGGSNIAYQPYIPPTGNGSTYVQPVNNGPYVQTNNTAVAAAVAPTIAKPTSWTEYVLDNPDLSTYYNSHAAELATNKSLGITSMETYGAYHYSNFGATEGRVGV